MCGCSLTAALSWLKHCCLPLCLAMQLPHSCPLFGAGVTCSCSLVASQNPIKKLIHTETNQFSVPDDCSKPSADSWGEVHERGAGPSLHLLLVAESVEREAEALRPSNNSPLEKQLHSWGCHVGFITLTFSCMLCNEGHSGYFPRGTGSAASTSTRDLS